MSVCGVVWCVNMSMGVYITCVCGGVPNVYMFVGVHTAGVREYNVCVCVSACVLVCGGVHVWSTYGRGEGVGEGVEAYLCAR